MSWRAEGLRAVLRQSSCLLRKLQKITDVRRRHRRHESRRHRRR